MNSILSIRPALLEDIPSIEALARQIWPHTYAVILTKDQLEYMLQLIYHPDSLRDQMLVQHHCFLIAELDEEPVGFASYSRINDSGIYKLHKLYMRTDKQGMGLGKQLIDKIIADTRKENATVLQLNVNRHNKAQSFYEKLDFKIIKEQKLDIGNGYYMDDYVMEKKL